jgi:hypothetical protein
MSGKRYPGRASASSFCREKTGGHQAYKHLHPTSRLPKIRDIASSEDRRRHDLIMEGVDLVLKKYGFPSLTNFKKK